MTWKGPPSAPACRIYSSFTLLAIFGTKRQAGCRCPSNVPLRAPVRNAVHSEWVNDNTGPARSLEFRTSTDRPTKATSTQLPSPDDSLFSHWMLDRPGSAMRLSFAQAKKLRAVGCPPYEMSMSMAAMCGNRAALDLVRKASTAGPVMNARHACTVSSPHDQHQSPVGNCQGKCKRKGRFGQ